jgi:hypothetical protein
MRKPTLKNCPFLGPVDAADPVPTRRVPADHATRPFTYLPPKIALSQAELELAARYERGDFSGGYLTSQIARFRRGPTAEQHGRRRERFRQLRGETDRLGLVLPSAYVELVESDDYVTRLRHNSIWLRLPDELVSRPSHPEHKLFLIFQEAQGGAYWHLLLAPGGGHVVTYSEHPFGVRPAFLEGYEPDLASIEVYQCALSFSRWIVQFFAECIDEDRRYEEILKGYPGV